MKRIFAIGFLRAAPARVTQQIDAHRARQVAVLRANFRAHRFADTLLQVPVPASPTCHCGGKACRIAASDTSRSIGKIECRHVQAFAAATCSIRFRAPLIVGALHGFHESPSRHHRDFLFERSLLEDAVDHLPDLRFAETFSGGVVERIVAQGDLLEFRGRNKLCL